MTALINAIWYSSHYQCRKMICSLNNKILKSHQKWTEWHHIKNKYFPSIKREIEISVYTLKYAWKKHEIEKKKSCVMEVFMESDPEKQDTNGAWKLTLAGLGLRNKSSRPTGKWSVVLNSLEKASEIKGACQLLSNISSWSLHHQKNELMSLRKRDSCATKFLLTSSWVDVCPLQLDAHTQASLRHSKLYFTITISETCFPQPRLR